MGTKIKTACIVYYQWQTDGHVIEVRQNFTTLDELMAFCATSGEGKVVDRILIEDEEAHTLSLVFQSLSTAKK